MREPLDEARLRAALIGPYAQVDVVASTGSTNADLREALRAGGADRTVLFAEEQTAGQGRRARTWVSPPYTGLYVSVLLRPDVPPHRIPWITLLAGVALVRTATSIGVDAVLKWPNDLLAGPHKAKCAGVLAEADGGVVLGMGLNVAALPGDVPPGAGGLPATSLEQQGATTTDRTDIAVELLKNLAELDDAWRQERGDPIASGLHAEYRRHCSTLGLRVRIELPGDRELVGTGVEIDVEGQLVVRADDGTRHSVHAGDVVHLRSAAG
ncbi:BirA family biotin operon repressor/biotin-[acetyl-CoA-carboxylase] ligase [Kutzneria kofuensis]|uniref:biotin--[biotin carboxyl-carrier protein] ligase n=1 Tax=Kutzneria kofuensis TaxID=103725 RepID=A0A7W9KJC0_9PSEU|nr:biotin--[acetyl-CoA-carboxylase] ligase [Kutzneria kofuensis]MBB5893500.1 BirA family biotin operon repressor/biotin-[acetyl-CoA-carboxylase] ligase [Kutzneria kofuensis]